jgi:DNA invertase Pin-like site-specific DNA recombinase
MSPTFVGRSKVHPTTLRDKEAMTAARVTRQQKYDQQALDQLKSRLPDGATFNGSIITLPVPPGTPKESLAAASLRVSKGRDTMISPEIQFDEIARHSKSKGLVLYRLFLDMHKTGREFEKRAVKQIVEEVKSGEYMNVVLWKWSRWGRNVRWSTVYLAMVEDAGGQVRSASEDIDPKTAIGKFTRTQLLAIAELESDLKSEDWRATHENRRTRGLPHSSAPRFGYNYEPDEGYTIKEDEAVVLKELYERFVSGVPMAVLTKEMNGRGILTRSGNAWTPTSLGRMLDTGFAAGFIRERSNPPAAINNKSTLKDFDIWRVGVHPTIVDPALFERYKAIRVSNASKPRRLVGGKHALSGMLLCGECGGTMVSIYNGRTNKHSWICGKRQRARRTGADGHIPVTISNRRALKLARAWVETNKKGETDMAGRVKKAATTPAPITNVDNLKARVDALKGERTELSRMKMKKQISQEDYDAFWAENNASLNQAEIDLDAARAAAPRVRTQGAVWETLSAVWDGAEPGELGRMLSSVLAAGVIRPGPYSEDKAVFVPAWD